MSKNKKGFTLVELVIVIAVIAILAAVLIPTFAGILERARENARVQRATSARDEFFTSSDMISVNEMEGYIIDIDGYAYLVGENGQITNSGITEDILQNDPKTRLSIVNGNSLIYTPSTVSIPSGVYDSKMQLLYTWEEAISEGIMVIESNILKEFTLNEDYILCIDKSINNLESNFATYPEKCKKLILHNRVYLFSSALEGMTLPYAVSNGIKYIGNNENPYIYAIGQETEQVNAVLHEDCVGIYSKCFAGKGQYNLGKLKTIQVGDKLRYIGYSAFGYTNLTSFDMPDSVTLLQNAVFQYTKLTSLTLSNNIKTIPGYLLYHTSTLRSLEIPTSVTKLNSYAFYYSGLSTINIPDSVTSIGNNACAVMSNLTSFTISKNITTLPNYMFEQSGLTELVVPAHIKDLGHRSFGSSRSLKKVIVSEGVEALNSAFYNCVALEEIQLSSTVTSIGYEGFYECDKLTEIDLPEGFTTIGNYAFRYCEGLTEITLPSTTKTIGGYAFNAASNLTNVVLNEGLTSIGSFAFSSCNLTSLELPSTLEEMGDGAFANNEFTEVVVPKTVNYMGLGVFNNCVNLTKLEFMHEKDDDINISRWSSSTKYDALPVKDGLEIIVHVAKADISTSKNYVWYYCGVLGITPTVVE